MSSMCRQIWALLRRYLIVILRSPIYSLIRIVLWPGLLLGLCVWAVVSLRVKDKDNKEVRNLGARSMVFVLQFSTFFHVYSFCEYFVKDRATRVKSLMLSMGLRRGSYHLANGICMLMCLLPVTLGMTILANIYIFDDSQATAIEISALFLLFTLHLIGLTFALVSLITSTSYVALVILILIFETTLLDLIRQWVEKSGQRWRPYILFFSSFSPYQSVRIFCDSYSSNKNNGTFGFDGTFISEPTNVILVAIAFWTVLAFLFARWFEEACPWQNDSAVRGPCFCFETITKNNHHNEQLLASNEQHSSGDGGRYFETPVHRREVGIRVNHVTKTFSGIPAVSDLSFDIYKGETTLLLGHNGAGKTTLMNVILDLLQPDSGKVAIKGHRGDNERAAVSVGVCPQTSVHDDELSVSQHIELFVDIKSNLIGASRSENIRQTIEDVSLGAEANKRPGELSGGMKRKLSLGMAFAGKSEVLILDEPSSGLDPDSRVFVWNAIRRYRTNRTVLLSTQHMEEADYLGDRLAIMSDGQIVCCGSSLFLNNLFGSGYKLRIECQASKKKSILEHIKKYFSASKQTDTDLSVEHETSASENSNQVVDFVVELNDKSKSDSGELQMIKLLQDIESNSQRLGIKSFGLKSSSIEDVMLETSKFFSLDAKETSAKLEMTSANLKALVDKQKIQAGANGGHILFSLCMKNIKTHLVNWKSFIFFRLLAPGFAAYQVADYFNPGLMAGLFELHYTPKIANTFLVFHFIYYPVLERSTKFKIIQLTSSMGYFSYWLSMALVDVITLITNTIMINVFFTIFFTGYSTASMWTLHAILSAATILMGLSAMMISYLLSTVFSDPKSSIGYIFLLLNVGSFVELIIILLKIAMSSKDLNWMDKANNYLFVTTKPTEAFQYILYGLLAQGYILPSKNIKPPQPPKGPPPLIYGFGALLVQIITYLSLLWFLEAQNFDLEWYARPSNLCSCFFGARKTILESETTNVVDDDVMNETVKAVSVIRNVPRDTYSLVAANLSKSYYKQQPVVEGLSFAVNKAECFGLLGVNGAGKSTTFSMLIAESAPDLGEVWANGRYSHDSVTKYRQHLGYDPQQNPDIYLTPHEALHLMARLRLVPEARIPTLINSVLELLEMSQHAHKITSKLSGGTKRKLALGMALVGNPDLLALDEPTAGVDPVARRGIWRLLRILRSQNSASIIISSHAMEECEAICDRISVMARGRLRCVGTFLHLRSKFAQGCTLKVQFSSLASNSDKKSATKEPLSGHNNQISLSERRSSIEPIVSELKQRLESSVGSKNIIKLTDRNISSATFTIGDNRVHRSVIFKIMRDFRQKHSNVSYMINDSSLEDIFISIAREQQELDAKG